MTTYEIDGEEFWTLEGFYDQLDRALGMHVGHNLDALDEVLRGGWGTPAEGFTIRWKNHDVSRRRLDYTETVRQLEIRLGRCHWTNVPRVQAELQRARAGEGPTVFDWLVETFQFHGPGGEQPEDNVRLELA